MSTIQLAYNNYYVLKHIKKGSFGNIALAVKKSDQSFYTLKIIPIEKADSCLYEIDVLQSIKGMPNVIQYVEHLTTSKELIVVCEYCSGVDLFDYMEQNGHFSEIKAKKIFKQLCKTMHNIHKLGIVHRDIKPENIIIDDNLNITIIDWGLAFYPERTNDRISCGSPHYAAPELLSHNPRYEGPEVDVWALGCVMYILLTQEQPFNGDTHAELFTNIKSCKITSNPLVRSDAARLLKTIFVLKDRPLLEVVLKNRWLRIK